MQIGGNMYNAASFAAYLPIPLRGVRWGQGAVVLLNSCRTGQGDQAPPLLEAVAKYFFSASGGVGDVVAARDDNVAMGILAVNDKSANRVLRVSWPPRPK